MTDYITMLDFVIYSLENKVHSHSELSQIVNKDSEKHIVLRRKLQTMAKTIMENVKDEDIKQFAFEVDTFFHPVWYEVNISPYRRTESVLAKGDVVVNFYNDLTSPDDPQWLREIDIPEFRKTRKFLEKKWQSIVKIYTTLKIDTINPKKQRNLFKGWGKSKRNTK